MIRRLLIVVAGGAVLAALSALLPVALAPLLPAPKSVSSSGVRLPFAPPEYPDPNITWTTSRPGLVEESSVCGIGVYDSWHVKRLRAGWPIGMLEGGSYAEIHSLNGGSATGTVHAVNLKTWWSKDYRRRWELPTGLAWSGLGLVGNWLIWSAAIGAFFLPGAVRRARRRRRGLCLRCGYPRSAGVQVCAECGIKHAAA